MCIWFSYSRFMDSFHTDCSQDSNRNILCNNGLSISCICVEAFFPKCIVTEGICICSIQEPVRAVPAADCVCNDSEGEDWNAIFLGESNGGGCRVDGRFQGSMEGWEGKFKVDCIVWGSGLDGVVFKDGLD